MPHLFPTHRSHFWNRYIHILALFYSDSYLRLLLKVFLLLSLVVIASIILGSVDRILNSFCGASCGFIMNNPMIFNPIDTLLVTVSKVFPLDFVIIGILTIYIYFAALRGITGIGIRFLWMKLYSFKKGATMPQGKLGGDEDLHKI